MCDREECRLEWEFNVGKRTQDQEDRDYELCGMSWAHCQWEGCHNQYMRGNGGFDCVYCRKRLCEPCSCYHMHPELQVCNECIAEGMVEKTKKRRRCYFDL